MRNRKLIWRAGVLLVIAVTGVALAQNRSSAFDDYESGSQVYKAVKSLPFERINVGGGDIDVHFTDPNPPDRDEALKWIGSSAAALTAYFGRFPVKHLDLVIVSVDGGKVRSGTTFGFAGSAIRIYLGRDATAATFNNDWILVHEMVHAALPNVPRRSLWVQEGQAVYVEPIARVQAGLLDPREVWRWALVGMPKGEPAPGDLGLDGTHTWGRTYWGGALFWLLADIRIRERTENRIGLQTALRAISRESGGNTAEWSVDRLMRVGDAATGGHELEQLYQAMKDHAVTVDLATLFAQLGVSMSDGQVMFDERAPMAEIRRAITARVGPS